jgi:hypothetical protein
MSISQIEIDKIHAKIRRMSNSARFDEAYALAKKHMALHPEVLLFAYCEAVMSAEDDTGFTPTEVRARYKSAAKKLRRLLRRMRGATPWLRAAIRNEYYWFSRQPLKQYRLGREQTAKGNLRSYYSQGVGAVEVAKGFARKGRRGRALVWARKSEKAWLNFFKVNSKWFNSYFFYAMALGYQGRLTEMEKALATGARIAGKTMRWQPVKDCRRDILAVRKYLEPS